MTFQDLKAAFQEAGIEPGEKISHDRYVGFILKLEHEIRSFVMDCFTPDGKAVWAGYEDSLESYWFDYKSWDELQVAWDMWYGTEKAK